MKPAPIGDEHSAGLVVETDVGTVVADALDRIARDLNVIDVGIRRDLTGEHDQTGIDQCFSRDTGVLVLAQDRVEDRIGGSGPPHLVRMAFRDRFRGKESPSCLYPCSMSCAKTNALGRRREMTLTGGR